MSSSDLFQTIGEALGEAWGTLFSKKVTINNVQSAPCADNESVASLQGSYVRCAVSFSGDHSGEATYFISEKQALTMVGMMLSMGADDALIESTREKSVGEEEIDALKEAFNQLAATSATVLRDKHSCTVQAEPSTPELITLEGTPEGISDEDTFVSCDLDLEGYDSEPLYACIGASLDTLFGGGALDDDGDFDAILEDVAQAPAEQPSQEHTLEAIRGLKVQTDVILAERVMDFTQLLSLNVGSVVEFWKPCDHPADLSLADTVYANGEIVITESQSFALRILQLSPPKRIYQKGIP